MSRNRNGLELRVSRPRIHQLAVGRAALGAVALGAIAVGSLAIGALAIGYLRIKRGYIASLRIGELDVDRLIIREHTDGSN
jgi:hypothetical protein